MLPAPGALPAATLGGYYFQQICGRGYWMQPGTYTYTVTGSLPAGLVTSEGCCETFCDGRQLLELSGAPTTPGLFTFNVLVEAMGCSTSISGDYSIQVSPTCFLTVTGEPKDGSVGATYAASFLATGGVPPYRYAITAGSLPPGVILRSWGVLQGAPSLAGSYTFSVGSTSADFCMGSTSFDVEVRDRLDLVAGLGLGTPNPNAVRILDPSGGVHVDLIPYGASHGLEAAGFDPGHILRDCIVTGPGPGPVSAPHVRAFSYMGAPLPPVSFFAYATMKFGVHPAASDLDGDGLDEILTGAGAGAMFGPQVRGFDVDGVTQPSPIAGINYFAYGSLAYGVNVAAGGLDGASLPEILTGPGPGGALASTVRAWRYGNQQVVPISRVNFNAFPAARYGARVGTGDVDADLVNDILAARGAGSTQLAQVRGFRFDGTSVTQLPGLDATPFPTLFGAFAAGGDVDRDGTDDVLTGAGPDPAATSSVRPYAYGGGTLTPLAPIDAFPGRAFGVNAAAGHCGY